MTFVLFLFLLFLLAFIICLIIFLAVIYSAHKEYIARKTLAVHKPIAKRKKEELKSELPLLSTHAMDNIFLSLVFPAYNEEKRISPVIKETVEFFDSKKIPYEIIIVNDGSRDGTLNLLFKEEEKYPHIPFTIVTYAKNGGKGYAVKTGMTYARGEYILMLDSDGATQISDYDKLLKNIEKEKLALAIGSRKIETENVERTFIRNLFGIVNNFIVQNLVGVRGIKDTQCGFKLFTREAARNIFFNVHLARWAFDVEMFYICNQSKIKVIEVPVTWREKVGSHLVVLTAAISFFRDYFAIIIFYGIGLWKISKEFEKKLN